MSKLILATTSSKGPGQNLKIVKDETIVLESDKIMVFPRNGGASSLILANGYEFEVAAEVAEIATAMQAADASTYT